MCGKWQYGQPPGGDRDTGMAEWDTGSLNWQSKGDTQNNKSSNWGLSLPKTTNNN